MSDDKVFDDNLVNFLYNLKSYEHYKFENIKKTKMLETYQIIIKYIKKKWEYPSEAVENEIEKDADELFGHRNHIKNDQISSFYYIFDSLEILTDYIKNKNLSESLLGCNCNIEDYSEFIYVINYFKSPRFCKKFLEMVMRIFILYMMKFDNVNDEKYISLNNLNIILQ
jgi:hypothetical protein